MGYRNIIAVFLSVGVLIFTGGSWGSPAFSQEPSSSVSSLHYVSDYFSFIGQEDRGHVAFALDTNRGRDGKEWQAEHYNNIIFIEFVCEPSQRSPAA